MDKLTHFKQNIDLKKNICINSNESKRLASYSRPKYWPQSGEEVDTSMFQPWPCSTVLGLGVLLLPSAVTPRTRLRPKFDLEAELRPKS